MLNTLEALKVHPWVKTEFGYVLKMEDGFEVCLEQLIFDKQWYLAVYKDLQLMAPKVVVHIGKE